MTLRAIIVALLSVVLDQMTKWLVVQRFAYQDAVEVLPFFSLVRWHNEGAAFSILAGAGDWKRWFFVGLGVVFCSFIFYELRRLPKGERVMWLVYGLLLGGAIGNLIDRFAQGYVVDFLLFHWGSAYFPAFNIADASLFCGAVIWIFVMLQEWRAERQAADV